MTRQQAFDAIDAAAADHVRHLFDVMVLSSAGSVDRSEALVHFEAGLRNTAAAHTAASGIATRVFD